MPLLWGSHAVNWLVCQLNVFRWGIFESGRCAAATLGNVRGRPARRFTAA